jgi:hypothetical protein
MKRYFLKIWASLLLLLSLTSCVSEPVATKTTKELEPIKEVPPMPVEKKPPLFLLNQKDTIQLSNCKCKAVLLNNEERNFAGRFVNIMTPEADREFKMVCSGSLNNKTKYKLSNMNVVFHLMSATEYPLYDSKPVEFLDNYILPNKKSNFEIDVLYERGLSLFMKKVAKVNCEIHSIKETVTGEVLNGNP